MDKIKIFLRVTMVLGYLAGSELVAMDFVSIDPAMSARNAYTPQKRLLNCSMKKYLSYQLSPQKREWDWKRKEIANDILLHSKALMQLAQEMDESDLFFTKESNHIQKETQVLIDEACKMIDQGTPPESKSLFESMRLSVSTRKS